MRREDHKNVLLFILGLQITLQHALKVFKIFANGWPDVTLFSP